MTAIPVQDFYYDNVTCWSPVKKKAERTWKDIPSENFENAITKLFRDVGICTFFLF